VSEKTFKNHRRDLLNEGAVLQDGPLYCVSQRGLEAYFSTTFGEGVGRGWFPVTYPSYSEEIIVDI
jgi:hypothetical protein